MKPLAVSLGDPAGVGPELLVEAWLRREEASLGPFFAVGGVGLLAAAAEARGIRIPVKPIANVADVADAFREALPVLGDADGSYRPGEPDRDGAKLALASLTEAARLAVAGEAGGIVTGPIAKGRLAEVGFSHPGQTEFVAEASGIPPEDAVMMLAGPTLRTVPLTVHIGLADVAAALSAELVRRRCAVIAAALQRDFGIDCPRLAIAGLNPHAGEDGRFGDEEGRVIIPAITALRAQGITVTGPHPADAMFAPHARGDYDVAVCMYHDQALIPLKALDFDNGVNVTLGLPIVRTSPDHGTAFAIAGKRRANPGATIAAIRMGGECARRRAAG